MFTCLLFAHFTIVIDRSFHGFPNQCIFALCVKQGFKLIIAFIYYVDQIEKVIVRLKSSMLKSSAKLKLSWRRYLIFLTLIWWQVCRVLTTWWLLKFEIYISMDSGVVGWVWFMKLLTELSSFNAILTFRYNFTTWNNLLHLKTFGCANFLRKKTRQQYL